MSKDEENPDNNNQMIKQPKYSEDGLLNKELFRNIEILDNENNQLKLLLAELREDLKVKDNSIEESHKIINKLKDEYSKIIKDYQNLEKFNNELSKENDINKNIVENSKKANELMNKLKEKNDDLLDEVNRLKKDNALMKTKLVSNNNLTTKKDQDIKEKELIINDLKQKGENWSSSIKEREQIINEQSIKIKELSDIISRKDEQLKVMVNFSKEINKENKTNVQELTKQAVKTIKVFYNTLNNAGYNNHFDTGNRVEIKEDNPPSEKFEDVVRQGRASFYLEDALNGMMYIPPGVKTISKEFLIDMNLKTELIKSELFVGLIREMNFVNFLEQIFEKLNINDMQTIKNICHKVITLKIKYDNILKQNTQLKKENQILKQNIKQYDLYTQKLKENVNNNLNKLKQRYLTLSTNIDSKVKTVKNNNIILKEQGKKDALKLKTEISILKNEILKLKKENLNLKNEIEELNNDNNNKNDNELNNINNLNNEMNKKEVIFEIENIDSFSFSGEINQDVIKDINENNINNINKIDSLNNIKYGNNIINRNLNNNFNSNNFISENNSNDFQNNIINNDNNIKYNTLNNNNQENISINQKENNNIISNNINNIVDENYIQLQEMIKENEKYKEINSNKIQELQNLLSLEKEKNAELIKELNSLKLYSDDLNKNISLLKHSQSKLSKKKNIFTPKLFLKLFFKINHKIFSSSEYKKFLQIYNSQDIYIIYDIFKKACESLKQKIYETHFEINTTNTDMDDYLFNTNSYNNSKKVLMNNSYKSVNERILKLKKFEFDMIIMNEFIKNYMVSQESVIQIIFNNISNVIQFDIIENLYKLLEDGLNFKIDEMNDNVIFHRKLLIKFFKNQKNCLGLSLEYISE